MVEVCRLALADKAAEAVEAFGDEYPCFLTVGLSYRRPRTRDKRMTAAELAEYIREYGKSYWWDVTDDGALHASAFSANDMF